MSRSAHSMTDRAMWGPIQRALHKYRDNTTGEDVFGVMPSKNTPHYHILGAAAHIVDRVPECTFWHRVFSDRKSAYHATLRVEYVENAFYFVAIQYVPKHNHFYINMRKDDRQLWDRDFCGHTIISTDIHLEGWCVWIVSTIMTSRSVDALREYFIDMTLEEGEIRPECEDITDVAGTFSPDVSPWN
jgi:hypothetical protein